MNDQAAWIDHEKDVIALAEQVRNAPWIALDSESNSMFAYKERVCLLQINAGGRISVIDTLALPPGPAGLAPLKEALEDPKQPCYVHGGEYDVGCLRRDYGIALAGVWDTQQAASFLGWERTGYGAVVERVCQVTLAKGHAQYDWGTRPIDPEAYRYAVDDVTYLPTVAEALKAEIEAADLIEEVSIANRTVEESGWSGGFDPAGFWRVKGVRDLDRKTLPLLTALWAWRDGVARASDLPPGRIIANELLLHLARQAPTNFGLLRKLGIRSWLLKDHADGLIELVRSCLDQPPEVPQRTNERAVDEAERRREIRLKDWRRAEAEKRKVPLQVVLPAKSLEHFKRYGALDLTQVPQLGDKRRSLYGDTLRRLCE